MAKVQYNFEAYVHWPKFIDFNIDRLDYNYCLSTFISMHFLKPMFPQRRQFSTQENKYWFIKKLTEASFN